MIISNKLPGSSTVSAAAWSICKSFVGAVPAILALLVFASVSLAQLTLPKAVDSALAAYPSIQAAQEQTKVAAAQVNLARTAYLPKADVLGQANVATHNNVFGLLLPQPVGVIPSISGPVLGTNSPSPVLGTAIGILVNWEPFDFGRRKAEIGVNEAARSKAAAEVDVTRLQVAAETAAAFLTIRAAEETEKAAVAAVTRAESFQTVINALVNAELRPGVEASRSKAEVAAARIQLIQARQAVAVAKAALAQWVGGDAASLGLAKSGDPEPPAALAVSTPEKSPFALAQRAAIDEIKARSKTLDFAYKPKINLEGSTYARGTGVQPNGQGSGVFSGLGPNIQNWSLGVNITFSASELPGIRAKRDAESHRQLADEARYKQIMREIDSRTARATAMLEGARLVAEQTPTGVAASREAEAQARARYQAGLGTITDVADAQRRLTQAEIDHSLARLNIWRGLLDLAITSGDLGPFLKLAEGL